jgi:p-aminobenzoyl-glutamate transporter AbgT
MSEPSSAPISFMQKVLDVVEKVGNKVPHAAVIFLVLIALVMLCSHILYLMGTSVTTEVVTAEAITPKDRLPTVTFGAGQNEVHTVKEYVDLPEFAAGCRLAVAVATLEG